MLKRVSLKVFIDKHERLYFEGLFLLIRDSAEVDASDFSAPRGLDRPEYDDK